MIPSIGNKDIEVIVFGYNKEEYLEIKLNTQKNTRNS